MDDTQGKSIQQRVVDEFGFEDLNDGKQQELLQKMIESVVKRVLVDAYVKLPDEKKPEFDQMMENINDQEPDKIDAYLRDNVADLDAIIENAIDDLKNHLG